MCNQIDGQEHDGTPLRLLQLLETQGASTERTELDLAPGPIFGPRSRVLFGLQHVAQSA